MPSETGARREREISVEPFRVLLQHLDPVEERAWEMHDDLRRKLICFFENGFPLEAEDLADQALDRIAQKLLIQDIREIRQFAFGVARNLRRETIRRNLLTLRVAFRAEIRKARPIQDSELAVIEHLDGERKFECYRKCLARLSREDQRLLAAYYPESAANLDKQREILAQELGTNLGNLRTRIARLRAQLEKWFEASCAPRSQAFRNRH